MAKHEVYVCSACGAESLQWRGQCLSCGAWNTLSRKAQNTRSPSAHQGEVDCLPLCAVTEKSAVPYSSGLTAFDRILGQGLIPGGAFLLGGEPGIGKSTLLLQVAGNVAASGKTVLYASGEEALPQIRARAERLGALDDHLLALASTSSSTIISAIEKVKPSLIILDSVQTVASDAAEGQPGNVSQVRAVTFELMEVTRRLGVTLLLVGHVTKDGSLAGPRLLEHMVDTVMALEGDRRQMVRLLRVFKNRFGPNEELLVFRMEEQGMQVVEDPSTFFLEDRDPSLSGTAVVMAVDGQRPLAVEVQALVSRSFLTIPRRTALGFDVNRLNLLLAVLEKRLKLNFSQVDIYAKVGGGIRLAEPGLDLALVAAVLSSYYDLALPEKSIFWGEVDLNGQIRPVASQKQRLAQARRLGFSPLFHPDSSSGPTTLQAIQTQLFHR